MREKYSTVSSDRIPLSSDVSHRMASCYSILNSAIKEAIEGQPDTERATRKQLEEIGPQAA